MKKERYLHTEYARSKEEAVKIAAQFSDEYNNATIYDTEV